MLRLVLDWASRHPNALPALPFVDGSRWWSEALLGSRFGPRKRGDTSAEGATHADAVIGHFRFRPGGRADIELLPGAGQLTVIEAKLGSGLSPGTKYAQDFNQAARNVACMAHLIEPSSVPPATFGFVVIAPGARIAQGTFGAVNKADIEAAVRKRAVAYDEVAVEWCVTHFASALAGCDLAVVAWETLLEQIGAIDSEAGADLGAFYEQCIRWNRLLVESGRSN